MGYKYMVVREVSQRGDKCRKEEKRVRVITYISMSSCHQTCFTKSLRVLFKTTLLCGSMSTSFLPMERQRQRKSLTTLTVSMLYSVSSYQPADWIELEYQPFLHFWGCDDFLKAMTFINGLAMIQKT